MNRTYILRPFRGVLVFIKAVSLTKARDIMMFKTWYNCEHILIAPKQILGITKDKVLDNSAVHEYVQFLRTKEVKNAVQVP